MPGLEFLGCDFRMNHAPSPFLGRRQELDALRERLEDVRDGGGSLVVIAGESGIGKTRLTQEFSERAAASGALVVWGRCWELELGAPAFAPWLEALGAILEEAGGQIGHATLRELFSEFRSTGASEADDSVDDGQSDDLRFRVFGRIVDLIRAAGAATSEGEAGRDSARPVVLVLDDLQWADSASLLLLRYVARVCSSLPLLLIAAYDGEAPSRSSQLGTALAAIEREGNARRLDLGGLAEPEVQELAATLVGKRDPRVLTRMAAEVYRRTDGNPFFAQELLRALPADGPNLDDLRRVPSTVRDVVEGRLSHLPDRVQEILRIAAVVGPEFDVWVVERVAHLPAEEVDRALDEAEQANFIAPIGTGGRYRFTHRVTREAVYSGAPSRARMRTHRAVAEVLEGEYGAGAEDHASELAYHFGEVGDTERTLHYRLEAGERARIATAWEEAAGHYAVAADLIAREGDRRHEAEVLFTLGRCWRLAGASRRAWDALMRSLSTFEEIGVGIWAARAAVEALTIPAAAGRREALARRGLAALKGADAHLEARLHLSLALWSLDPDDESRSRAHELAQAHGLVDVTAALEQQQANEALVEGRLEDARTQLEDLYHLSVNQGRLGWALRFLTSASSIAVFAGDLEAGEAGLLRTIAFSDGAHPLWEGGLLTWLAGLALARGNAARSNELIGRARNLHPDSFRVGLLQALHLEVAGDPQSALALMPEPDQVGGYPGWLAIVHGSRARVLYEFGEGAAADDELERWAQQLSPFRTSDGSPSYLHTLSCVDVVLAEAGTTEQVALVDAELARWGWARFAPGNACSLDRLRGDLARRLGRLDDAESSYRAGVEWAVREGCEVELGRCHVGLGRLALVQSRQGEALERFDQAIRLLRRSGAHLFLREALAAREGVSQAWTSEPEVEITLPTGDGADLSPRELEVLALIADGHTNREIADRLTISVNTVARHVTHIFNKTGVSNRAEAVSYAHRFRLLRRS